MIRLSDESDEEIACPYCRARIKFSLRITATPKVKKIERYYGEGGSGPYTKGIPNIGAYAPFFKAKLGSDESYVANGNIALRNCVNLELAFERPPFIKDDHIPDLGKALDELPDEPYECFPVEMKGCYVHMAGENVSMTVNKRDVDFMLAAFPCFDVEPMGR